MSCTSNLPILITGNDSPTYGIPKFIKLKNLPVSPKYRARMETSQFDETIDKLSDLEVVEFPVLLTPPISPIKPNISPRKTKQMIKLENTLVGINSKKSKLPTGKILL